VARPPLTKSSTDNVALQHTTPAGAAEVNRSGIFAGAKPRHVHLGEAGGAAAAHRVVRRQRPPHTLSAPDPAAGAAGAAEVNRAGVIGEAKPHQAHLGRAGGAASAQRVMGEQRREDNPFRAQPRLARPR
jgi:hypothetical protein